MISQSRWLYTKSGITAVENSPKIEVESAHLWRAPLYILYFGFNVNTHDRLHQTMARPRPAQVCSRAIIRFAHLFSQKDSWWNITTGDAMALICIVVDFYV